MLDKEIYGLIVALGVALAIFFVGFYCLNINIANIRLRKKYRGREDMQGFVKAETLKGLLLILVEVLLCAVLLLIKEKFL